ncbi:putative glycolipid-binding domain-containing protein [Microbacterium sp. SLBN-146]|uniref:putative glycolipid-binding domain-containing protein n=1 Tax=Microbacterium sp. SLBN-146 TaxID=2768457 RepID=UPI00114D995F|nr:putative glycolipid-binding domain-containing protein [Microbacterium sp. SLBN-146]TQJ31494.1 hypothetical protein FBY39_1971 [Microbacterium sp. SLBN-146]
MKRLDLAWRGIDDEARVDRARVRVDDDGMIAHGTSITDDYALSWSLDATEGWITRTLGVTVHGDGWWRALALAHSHEGVWTAHVETHGDVDLPLAGIEDDAALGGALDCDLGLCPVTNTMPIRRLGLLDADADADADICTTLVMAWVEVPSLRVLRSDQVYRYAGPALIGFRSGDFAAEISVDGDGFVIDYPQLARRVPSP